MDTCQWKLVVPEEFSLGMKADRCGEPAAVKVMRPDRKKDLFLCEGHTNAYIDRWGLSHQIEFLR